jgi:hypothetical protein
MASMTRRPRPRAGWFAAALSGALSTAVAQPAMHLSTTGTGQVLIYPYYTTHAGLTTVLTVSNTTGASKALRVRVLEGVASAPTLSFTLYLGSFSTWSAALAPAGPGDSGAVLITGTVGCTVPALAPGQPVPLSVDAFTGPNQDWDEATTSPSRAALLGGPVRTRDGHIEVIELGGIVRGSPFAVAQTPADCARHREAWAPGGAWTTDPARDITLPSGGLRGEGVLVDAAQGIVYGYAPVAIGGFHTDSAAPAVLHTPPTAAGADLRDARSGDGVVRVELPATEARASRVEVFPQGLPRPDAVTALLTRSALHGEAILDPGLGADTEWVVTMPTRRWYLDAPPGSSPFQFQRLSSDGSLCHNVMYTVFTRSLTGPFPFAPFPRVSPGGYSILYPTLCSAASVASVRRMRPSADTRLLGARAGLTGLDVGRFGICCFQGGQISLSSMDDYDRIQSSGTVSIGLASGSWPWTLPSGRRLSGLPALGLAVTRYINANAQPGVLANYGMALPMASEITDRPPPP